MLYLSNHVVNHCVHFDMFPAAKSNSLKDESSGELGDDNLFRHEILFSLKVKLTDNTFNILVALFLRFDLLLFKKEPGFVLVLKKCVLISATFLRDGLPVSWSVHSSWIDVVFVNKFI